MKKRGKSIKINLTNRWLYTLIAIGILAIIGVGVYAYSGNVGHTSDQIDEADPTVKSWAKTDNPSIPGTLIATAGRTPVYAINTYCSSPNSATFSSTCSTRQCGTIFGGTPVYYDCSGGCTTITSPVTCNNNLRGYLV